MIVALFQKTIWWHGNPFLLQQFDVTCIENTNKFLQCFFLENYVNVFQQLWNIFMFFYVTRLLSFPAIVFEILKKKCFKLSRIVDGSPSNCYTGSLILLLVIHTVYNYTKHCNKNHWECGVQKFVIRLLSVANA